MFLVENKTKYYMKLINSLILIINEVMNIVLIKRNDNINIIIRVKVNWKKLNGYVNVDMIIILVR